jgi:integrase
LKILVSVVRFRPWAPFLNFAINEFGYGFSNAFTGVYIAPDEEKEKRRPLTADELKSLSAACREANDDLRHLLAMLLDTGMRLSEAAGLHVSDIHLEHEFPYVEVRPNKARRLKTSNSKRIIPLVGDSLWAAQQVTANTAKLLLSKIRQRRVLQWQFSQCGFGKMDEELLRSWSNSPWDSSCL